MVGVANAGYQQNYILLCPAEINIQTAEYLHGMRTEIRIHFIIILELIRISLEF